MSEIITNKNEMKLKTQKDLDAVQAIIEDASKAINDKSRTMKDSPLNETLAGALGAGAGAAIGFAGLYFGGVTGLSAAGITSGLATAGSIVGGGMAAGIGVLAAPAVVLGAAGVGVVSHMKKSKLIQNKEVLYIEAIKKQNGIIEALKAESKKDKERISYLTALNLMLQKAIEDLKFDLGK